MPITIDMSSVIARLQKIEAEVLKEGQTELEAAAALLIQKAQSKARKDSGFMADNIKITEKSPNKITVTSIAPYSIFNEEGTRYMSPQPFMFNSALEVEQDFIGKLGNKIKAATAEKFR